MEGAELEFRDEALRAVAHRAMQRKTGARGLRTILETVLLDTMYELPSMRNVSRSEEHTSELQSQSNLVCRLLLEKKKKILYFGSSHNICTILETILQVTYSTTFGAAILFPSSSSFNILFTLIEPITSLSTLLAPC